MHRDKANFFGWIKEFIFLGGRPTVCLRRGKAGNGEDGMGAWGIGRMEERRTHPFAPVLPGREKRGPGIQHLQATKALTQLVRRLVRRSLWSAIALAKADGEGGSWSKGVSEGGLVRHLVRRSFMRRRKLEERRRKENWNLSKDHFLQRRCFSPSIKAAFLNTKYTKFHKVIGIRSD